MEWIKRLYTNLTLSLAAKYHAFQRQGELSIALHRVLWTLWRVAACLHVVLVKPPWPRS